MQNRNHPAARAAQSPAARPAVQPVVQPLEARQLMSAAAMHSTLRILHPTPGVATPAATTGSPDVFTPKQLRKAYGMDAVKFGSTTGDGTGQTIAIVDAYDDPTIKADLAAFDKDYGLAAPPSFTVMSQTGSTTNLPQTDPAGAGSFEGTWEGETALDVEWAHAVAPGANLVLIETDDDGNLFAGVVEARKQANVSVVSMSWGGDEADTDAKNYDKDFTTPAGHTNMTFVASAGDDGAFSDEDYTTPWVGYPAASVNVVGVGGTSLTTKSDGTYTAESGWGDGQDSGYDGGGGGGISYYTKQPSYQAGVVTQSKTYRAVPDVALDADPNTGVNVIDSWDNGDYTPTEVGGTSLAAPMWAGVIAIADQGRVLAGAKTLDGPSQTLPDLYKLSSADFHDVTTGNNGYAAGKGYDLVTGLGTPIVNKLTVDLAAAGVTPTASPITGTVLAWDTNKQSGYGTNGLSATTVVSGATNSTKLTRGSGVKTTGTAVANAWGGVNWSSTSSAGISGSKYVTFGFTVGTGRTAALSAISLNYRRASGGPSKAYWEYKVGTGSYTKIADVTNAFPSTSTSGATMTPLSLTGVAALQKLAAGTVVTFRLTPYGGTSSTAGWYVYDGGKNHTDLSITAAAAQPAIRFAAAARGTTAGTPTAAAPISVQVIATPPTAVTTTATVPPVAAAAAAPVYVHHRPAAAPATFSDVLVTTAIDAA